MTAEMISAIFTGLTGLLVAYLAWKTAQLNSQVATVNSRVEEVKTDVATVKTTADELRSDVATVHKAVNSNAAEASRLLADANDRLASLASTGVLQSPTPRPPEAGQSPHGQSPAGDQSVKS